MRFLALFATLGVLGVSAIDAAAARPYGTGYYAPVYEDPLYLPPAPTAFVFRRHTPRCDYPRGFNVTDFDRDVGGIPRGGEELIATHCAAFEPFAY